MKKLIALTALASVAAVAGAQEQGRVLSVTPITQQVAVPQQVCGNETIYSDSRPTGAGAVLGAVAGGAAGNAIGGGSGRAAATVLGVIGGAVLGNNIEGGRPGYQNVQRCSTQTYYENRAVGYDVTYEYAGRQYTTRTQNDPGQWIPLNVQPAVPGMVSHDPYAQQPGVVTTAPGPAAYVSPPVTTVIEYRNSYGHPYYPPRPRDPYYWR